MQLKTYFFFLILIACSITLSAQKLHFRQFKPNIPNAPEHISKLLQDKEGFIWLGTEKGLLQFDGITYTPFYLAKHNQVTALFQDDSGKVWQGYKNGEIHYINRGKNIRFQPEEGLPKVAINAILQDKEKRIWFATYGEGVYYFHKNRLYNINTDDGLADNYTYDLELDKNGNIWVAMDRGLSKIHISNGKKIVETINQENGLPDNLVTSLKLVNNTLYIGTQLGGFCTLDIPDNKIINKNTNWRFGQINNFSFNVNGTFTGTPIGLIQIDLKQEKPLNIYTRTDLFGIQKITDQLRDKEGNLWIAGGAENICMANTDLQVLQLKNYPEIKSIRAVEKFVSGYFIGTENGVYFYNLEISKLERTDFPELNKLNVTALLKAGNKLVIGTLGQGIYIYNLEKKWLKHYNEKDGLVNDNILSLTQRRGRIYIATLGGASVINAESEKPLFGNFNRTNGLAADYIYYVFEDSKNNIWFCTDGKGLLKWDNKKFTVYNEKNGLPSRTVNSITEENDGYWIATADGLYNFKDNKFHKKDIDNKLIGNNLRGLIADKGNLIITHKNGFDTYGINAGAVKTFGAGTGLQLSDPELNAWSQDAVNDNEGHYILAFGSTIVEYYNKTPGEVNQPQTRIKNISLFLDSIPAEKTDFSHNENHISFDYIGLWFHHPEQVNYQVKLEGYDPDWVNTKNHFITYPNLPPGKYTFKVRSSASNNFNGASEATYSFVISAPFWKRAWFYIPLILLLASGVYFYIRQREKMLKKDAAIARQNIEFQYETLRSQVNPHFLFNSFNTLAGVIETDQRMAVEYVENLSDFFRNLLVYKDKDVIPLCEELQLLDNYFFIQKKRFGENLRLDINIDEQLKPYLLPPLCIQLLIENAIKHNIISREKPLNISLKSAGSKLVVQNNLQPKVNMEKSAGIGLANIKSRYSLLTSVPVNIHKDEKYFTVELPLIPPKK